MPYITEERREQLGLGQPISGPGELNYLITCLLRSYWVNSANNYQAINDIVGAMEGAKAEFQRQIVNPYEDKKIEANGRVY